MSKFKVTYSVKCPYYKGEDRHEIFCREPSEVMSIHVAFAVPTEKKEWMDNFCKSITGCEECKVKKVFDKK